MADKRNLMQGIRIWYLEIVNSTVRDEKSEISGSSSLKWTGLETSNLERRHNSRNVPKTAETLEFRKFPPIRFE